ncbi:MAG TPA: rhodanese-like domain-containing protein [Candidatus Sericytochromatia bacterium]|jgi:adenylyltransferase/sulfurtransferase
MLMQSELNQSKSNPWGDSLSKISQLPIVGNRVLQLRVPQMSVQQLKQLLDQKASNILLIDVRYKSEYDMAHLPGAVLVPMPEIKSGQGIAKIKKLLEDKRQANPGTEPHLIVICKAGVRSAKMLLLLQEAGITGSNLTGGMDAWGQEIDGSIPRYSIQNISEFQPFLAKQRSQKKRLLTGGGLAVASFAVASVLSVAYSSDVNRVYVQAPAFLEKISGSGSLSSK